MAPNRIALGLLIATVTFGLVLWLVARRAEPPPGGMAVPAWTAAGERPVPPLPPGVQVRLPVFDILRIEPSGSGAAQGRAEPRARIALKSEAGLKLGTVDADERGEWVIVIAHPLPPGDHLLDLVAEMPDGRGVRSAEQAVVSLPDKPEGRPLVVLMSPNAVSQVLQSPEGPETRPLCLEAVDEDGTGALRLGGRADPGRLLRIYADNRLLAQIGADDEGHWLASLGAGTLAPGIHRFRLDQLREDGGVEERMEVRFEGLSAGAGKPDKAEARVPLRIVRSEDGWQITSRDEHGAARRTIIYGAEAGRLVDPAPVYPGQVPPTAIASPPEGIVPAADR